MENEFQDNKYESHIKPVKRSSSALKLLWGVLFGIAASGVCLIVPIIRLPGILLTFLPLLAGFVCFGLGDIYSLASFSVTYFAVDSLAYGISASIVMALIVLPPLWLFAYLSRKLQKGFFSRMYLSLAVELICLVAALGLITLFSGKSAADLFTQALESSLNALPEETREIVASYYRTLYSMFDSRLADKSASEVFDYAVSQMSELIKLSLPSMLLVFAVLNVLPGAAVCALIRVKKGVKGEEAPYIGQWRLPASFTGGLIAVLIAAFVTQSLSPAHGQVVMYTALTGAVIMGIIQYAASWWDRLLRMGMTKGIRIAFFCVDTLFFFRLVPVYGWLSMLVGSRGLFRSILPKRGEPKDE
ncbi:MAG: YybS family protein [Clostridiales bacterium]|nr:YybS family protein [Clostridiales bacterium]